jgi:hypothetical protein
VKIDTSPESATLDSIPAIYYDPNFNLRNPHIFNAVASTSTLPSDLQSTLMAQLSFIEKSLVKEISRRSDSFFTALKNLQSLHTQTQECVIQINALRRLLSVLSRTLAFDALEIVQLKRTRGSLVRVYGSVKLVNEVRQTMDMILVLMASGEFVGSLDLISETLFV